MPLLLLRDRELLVRGVLLQPVLTATAPIGNIRKGEGIAMTTLLELAPRDAGSAPPEIEVEFLEGTTLHEIAACWITCTMECRITENSVVPSADDAI